MRCITIRQPFAELIIRGIKRCENRDWRTIPKIKNEWIAIHTSQKPEQLSQGQWDEYGLDKSDVTCGAIIGAMLISKACWYHDVPKKWKRHEHTFGPVCFLIDKAVQIMPVYYRGRLGLWECPSIANDRIQNEIVISHPMEYAKCFPS